MEMTHHKLMDQKLEEIKLTEAYLGNRAKELDSVQISLDSRAKLLDFKEKTVAERMQRADLKENQLGSIRDLCEERFKELEAKERVLDDLIREIEFKEKQFDNNVIKFRLCPGSFDHGNDLVVDLGFIYTMNGKGLQSFLNDHADCHDSISGKVLEALKLSKDPAMLVLDAMEGFYPPHFKSGDVEFEEDVVRRSCIMLLLGVMRISREIGADVKHVALGIANEWKAKMSPAVENSFEVLGFLSLLAAYELGGEFEADELLNLYKIIPEHIKTPELYRRLGFVGEIVDMQNGATPLHQDAPDSSLHQKHRNKKGETQTKSQYRSNLYGLMRKLQGLCYNDSHRDMLSKTPFWCMLDAILNKKIEKKLCRRSDNDLEDIIKLFNSNTKSFILGGKNLYLNSTDIKLIFGIADGHIHIEVGKRMPKAETAFIQRRFKDDESMRTSNIAMALKSALEGDRVEDVEDVVRLTVLLMLVTVFVPNKEQTLGWIYIKYIEDLQMMRNYNWSQHIFMNLHTSLMRSSNPRSVRGCAMVLPYWLCEHVDMVKPLRNEACPRFLKWDLIALRTTLKNLGIMKVKGYKLRSALTATSSERKLLRHTLKTEDEEASDAVKGDDSDSNVHKETEADEEDEDESEKEALTELLRGSEKERKENKMRRIKHSKNSEKKGRSKPELDKKQSTVLSEEMISVERIELRQSEESERFAKDIQIVHHESLITTHSLSEALMDYEVCERNAIVVNVPQMKENEKQDQTVQQVSENTTPLKESIQDIPGFSLLDTIDKGIATEVVIPTAVKFEDLGTETQTNLDILCCSIEVDARTEMLENELDASKEREKILEGKVEELNVSNEIEMIIQEKEEDIKVLKERERILEQIELSKLVASHTHEQRNESVDEQATMDPVIGHKAIIEEMGKENEENVKGTNSVVWNIKAGKRAPKSFDEYSDVGKKRRKKTDALQAVMAQTEQ